jgi:hypothetical protein
MAMAKHPLKRLEEQLERWIEGSIAQLIDPFISVVSLTNQLAQAMQGSLRQTDQGLVLAPDHYRIKLHPQTLEKLKSAVSGIEAKLASGVRETAQQMGYTLVHEPILSMEQDPSMRQSEICVTAWHHTAPLEDTARIHQQREVEAHSYPQGAFLIVDGRDHFPLSRPVINIGRRQENHLVLDGPLVSRMHAQIRAKQGHFVLFDLGSKAGTFVQGIPIEQHILQSGDVITIADNQLVYVEEEDLATDETIGFNSLA